jgi:predicted RNA binding protein with dsRBD fold (UPF0201 family)
MTPNTIQFSGTGGTWVMRITADRRIEVNEDVDVTEAAQKVLDALQHLLKPAPVQEPVAPKPWVGLTEEERNDLEDFCEMIIGKAAFDAIEAKLKEKNHG